MHLQSPISSKPDRIIAIDPSGNFKEGSGTTGIAVLDFDPMENKYQVTLLADQKANDYSCKEEYWNAIIQQTLDLSSNIEHWHIPVIICEEYPLYEDKSKSQSWSRLETPQLIGALSHIMWMNELNLVFQGASMIKNRKWDDEALVRKEYLQKVGNRLLFDNAPTNTHKRDALRHALVYARKVLLHENT